MRYLAEELLDLKPDQVMTVGDNFNDLEMLRYAGLGVAMGDAPAAVKQAADWGCPWGGARMGCGCPRAVFT